MSRFPGFLDRFRRLVTPPGRPAEALGVPASGDEVAAELTPLLGRLGEIEAQARAIEERGREAARERRERAELECAAILEESHRRADAERVRVVAEGRAQARRSAEAVRAEAAREVERVRGMREQAVEQLVAEVLACVRRAGR